MARNNNFGKGKGPKNNGQNNTGGNNNKTCTFCKKPGHLKADCYGFKREQQQNNGTHPNKPKNNPNKPSYEKKTLFCNQCGNKGHLPAECALHNSFYQEFLRDHGMDGLEHTGSSSDSVPVNSATISNLIQQCHVAVSTAQSAAEVAREAASTRAAIPPAPIVLQTTSSSGCNGKKGCCPTTTERWPRNPNLDDRIDFQHAYMGGRLAQTDRSKWSNTPYGRVNPNSFVTNYVSGTGYVSSPENIPFHHTLTPDFTKRCHVPSSPFSDHRVDWTRLHRNPEYQIPGEWWRNGRGELMICCSMRWAFLAGIGYCVGEERQVRTDSEGRAGWAWVRTLCGCVECRKLFLPEAARQASFKSELFGGGPIVFRFT